MKVLERMGIQNDNQCLTPNSFKTSPDKIINIEMENSNA